MEFIHPMTWDEWQETSQSLFRIRTPEIGWDLIVNQMLEQVLPNSIVRTLSDAEMEQYHSFANQPIVNLCGNFQTNFRLR